MTLTRSDLLTVLSVAICAAAAADMVHEALGHGIVSLLVGDPILSISSVALQNASNSRLVSAAGTSANLIAGALSLIFLGRVTLSVSGRLFLWLFGAFNLFNSGYLIFSAISGSGDWGNVISGLEPVLAWRALLAVMGGALYFFAVRWLDNVAPGIPDFRRVVVISYVGAGAVMTLAACLNPINPMLILISGLGASFGLNAGLLFVPDRAMKSGAVLPFTRSWVTVGLALGAIFFFVMGRGIRFAG